MTPEEFKSIFDAGVVMEKLNSIEGKIDDMKDSMKRGGERMGKLEEGQADCDKTTAVLTVSIETLEKDVDKLESAKGKFIGAILVAFLSQITQWVMDRKG